MLLVCCVLQCAKQLTVSDLEFLNASLVLTCARKQTCVSYSLRLRCGHVCSLGGGATHCKLVGYLRAYLNALSAGPLCRSASSTSPSWPTMVRCS